jgi:hypothetical protein
MMTGGDRRVVGALVDVFSRTARCGSHQSGCMRYRFRIVLPRVEGGLLSHGKSAALLVSQPIYRFADRIANEDHGGASQALLHRVDS